MAITGVSEAAPMLTVIASEATGILGQEGLLGARWIREQVVADSGLVADQWHDLADHPVWRELQCQV